MFEFLVLLFTAFFVSGLVTLVTFLWYGFIIILGLAILAKVWQWLMED